MISIFLSHNHNDRDFARQLRDRLRSHGIDIWLDEAEMHVGDSLISKIEGAIRDCEYLGVVLSPSSVSSNWVRREVNIALTQEIQGRRVKVLPLLFQKCELPGFLSDKLYADFTENFEEGFNKLLARINADLHDNDHKQRRVHAILSASYQDWLTFGKRTHDLLDDGRASLVIRYLGGSQLSIDLLEYIFCSICILGGAKPVDLSRLQPWIPINPSADYVELFNRLIRNSNFQIRLGAVDLVRLFNHATLIDVITGVLRTETLAKVKRAILACISSAGVALPREIAFPLFHNDADWLVRSFALKHLHDFRACLLVTDGTAFADQLGMLASEAGFSLVKLSDSLLLGSLDLVENQVLDAFELVILVRGNHYSQTGNVEFYSTIRKFVSGGGKLFATSWVSWENTYHEEFREVLPFLHIKDEFNEDVEIRCGPSENRLAKALFSTDLAFSASVERLEASDRTIVLCESKQGMPIFGYLHVGAGCCYYLNICQHSCLGVASSPIDNDRLRASLLRVFQWVYRGQHNEER